MASQSDIDRIVRVAGAQYRLSRRARRLLRVALEVLVFEIGPSSEITARDLEDLLFQKPTDEIVQRQRRFDIRFVLGDKFSPNDFSALMLLHILGQPSALRTIFSQSSITSSGVMRMLLDKD